MAALLRIQVLRAAALASIAGAMVLRTPFEALAFAWIRGTAALRYLRVAWMDSPRRVISEALGTVGNLLLLQKLVGDLVELFASLL